MTGKLDYSREDAMKILNNDSYTDEDKRKLYEEYMNLLKKNRKNAVVNKLNDYAKDIPSITKEIYISKLKEYENDDLSKPFEVIEEELRIFGNDMQNKYNEYLERKRQEEAAKELFKPDISIEPDEKFDDTIFSEPALDDVLLGDDDEDIEEVKPSLVITDEISVINEEPDDLDATLFSKNEKEFIPAEEEEEEDHRKGSASAIILSIIAVIIGIVVMVTIIKLN